MRKLILAFFLILTILSFADEMNTLGFDTSDYPTIKALVRQNAKGVSSLEINGLMRNFESHPLNVNSKVVIAFLVQEGVDVSKILSIDMLEAFNDSFSIRPLFSLWTFGNEIALKVPECDLDFFKKNLSPEARHDISEVQRLTDGVGFVGTSMKEKGDVRFLIVLSDGKDNGSKLSYQEAAGLLIESGVIPLFLGNWEDNSAPIKILQSIRFGGFYTVQKQILPEMLQELLTEISNATLMKFQGLGKFKESEITIGFSNGEKEAFQILVPPWNVRWFLSRNPVVDGGVEISFDIAGELVTDQIALNFKKIGSGKEQAFSESVEYSPGKVFFDSDRLDSGSWLYVVSSHNDHNLVSGITVFSKPPAPKLSMNIPPLTNEKNYNLEFEYQGGILLDSISVGNRTVKMSSPHLSIPITLKEGYNKINISYKDVFGRIFQPTPYSIYLDDSPPLLSISNAPKYTSSEMITLSGKVSDNVGMQSIKLGDKVLFLDGKEEYEFDFPVSISSGSNTIRLKVEDLAGNVTINELVVIGDFTPPEILQIQYPQITRNDEVLLHISAKDNTEVAGLRINGKEYLPSTNVFPVILPNERENEIEIEIEDVAGNVAMKSIDIVRDIIPPKIILPDKFVTKEKNVNFNFEVYDDYGLSRVNVNGKIATETEGKYNYSVTLEPGATKLIKIEAFDKAGNSAEKEVTVIYDVKPAEVQTKAGLFITRKVLFKDDFGLKRLYINDQELELSGEKEALIDIPFSITRRKVMVKVEDIGGNIREKAIYAYPWYFSPVILLLLFATAFFWFGVRVGVHYMQTKHQKQHKVKL